MNLKQLTLTIAILPFALAGCSDDSASTPDLLGGGDPLPEGNATIDLQNLTGSLQLAVNTPMRAFNSGGTFLFPIQPTENTTGYVVELEWDAATMASEQLDLWVRVASAGAIPPTDPNDVASPAPPVGRVTGASPLRLALSIEDFPTLEQYSVIVRAAGPVGAAANQPFEVHVAEFRDTPFDGNYTALPQ